MHETSQPEKSSKNEPRGVPKWTQNSPELIGKIPKIPKRASQKSFLRDRFFDDFLDGQKIEKRGHDHLRVASRGAIGGPWAPLGDYRGINKDNPREDY